jgi:rhodanese-related sulfurtransferase
MQRLSVTELAAFANAAEAPVFLDVREPWEVAFARIDMPGVTMLHIPMMQIPMRLAEIPRERSVVCICHHGVRSAQVVAFLLRQGFDDVYNLEGGVDAWSRQIDPSVPCY